MGDYTLSARAVSCWNSMYYPTWGNSGSTTSDPSFGVVTYIIPYYTTINGVEVVEKITYGTGTLKYTNYKSMSGTFVAANVEEYK